MKLDEIKQEEESNGTYAGYRFDKDDLKKVEKWAKDNKIPGAISPDDYHCTLIYSRKPCPDYKSLGKLETPIVVQFGDKEIWDTNDGKTLVIKLHSDEMVERHKAIRKEHGATFDYDEYTPHLTISYDVGKDFNLDELEGPKGELKAVEEYGEELHDLKSYK